MTTKEKDQCILIIGVTVGGPKRNILDRQTDRQNLSVSICAYVNHKTNFVFNYVNSYRFLYLTSTAREFWVDIFPLGFDEV